MSTGEVQEGLLSFNEIQQRQLTNILVGNAEATFTTRQTLLQHMLDPRKDLNKECGYPDKITAQQYREMYDREGISTRVVDVLPQESWSSNPVIKEVEAEGEKEKPEAKTEEDTKPKAEKDEGAKGPVTNEDETTDFEQAFEDINDEHNLLHYMARVDELSGIGAYGLMLIGLNDAKELKEPVDGITDDPTSKASKQDLEITFIRVFDQSQVRISKFNADPKSRRFGYPEYYNIKFHSLEEEAVAESADSSEHKVHWSRVIHIADNRKSSEIYGVPRMQPVFNRLSDLRKTLGGSAEMFWKGAFPGYSFEVNEDDTDVTIDKAEMKKQFEQYSAGLQRYLALSGVTAKSLAPQVADPAKHFETQIKAIAITLAVPLRIFQGSESAHLASSQDEKTWNKRIARRRENYISPLLIRPIIERLIQFNLLPDVDEFEIEWEDLNTPSDMDKADVAAKITEALAKYVQGGVNEIIPTKEYLTTVLDFTEEEAEEFAEAAEKIMAEEAEEAEAAAEAEAEMMEQFNLEREEEIKAEQKFQKEVEFANQPKNPERFPAKDGKNGKVQTKK